MGRKLGQFVHKIEWAKHFKKAGKRRFWKSERQKSRLDLFSPSPPRFPSPRYPKICFRPAQVNVVRFLGPVVVIPIR